MSFYSKISGTDINTNLINVDGSNYAGGFGSNEIPKSNMRGGKILKKKIKNITKQYKMSKKNNLSNKKKIMRQLSRGRMMARSVVISGGRRRIRRTNRRMSRRRKYQRGGQYGSNVPSTSTYSTGGLLSPVNSALANSIPYNVLNNNTNCVDNYNHYLRQGSQTI